MPPGYRIRPATPGDLPALDRVESRASELYSGLVPEEIPLDNVPPETLRDACENGRLFVAEARDGAVVGFGLLLLLDDGSVHLEELDVLPEHGRRGIGRALIDACSRAARSHGYTTLTLSTYRDVPFNAPYYTRLGFRALEPQEVTAALARVVEIERKKGLDRAPRVLMRREL
jgi:predicted N-acetyltransferase YhbS